MNAAHYSELTQGWHDLLRLNSNTVYVPIPKNAHTWMLRSFDYTQETHADIKDRFLVILRNPIDRWITGIGTYCGNNNVFKRELHSNQRPNWSEFFSHTLMPDGHTVPQAYFLRNIDLDRVDLFTLNPNLNDQISKYLNISPKTNRANVAKDSGYHRYIISSLTQYLAANSELRDQLAQLYSDDYKLLNYKEL
jgi:hypothetical protein